MKLRERWLFYSFFLSQSCVNSTQFTSLHVFPNVSYLMKQDGKSMQHHSYICFPDFSVQHLPPYCQHPFSNFIHTVKKDVSGMKGMPQCYFKVVIITCSSSLDSCVLSYSLCEARLCEARVLHSAQRDYTEFGSMHFFLGLSLNSNNSHTLENE